jgi:hypothetical protein
LYPVCPSNPDGYGVTMWLLPLLIACAPVDPHTSTPTAPGPLDEPTAATGLPVDTGVATLQATWTEDPSLRTWATVTWTAGPGDATLMWTDDAGAHTATVDALAGSLTLQALPAGSAVDWTLTIAGPEGVASSGPQQNAVPEAPPELGRWKVTEFVANRIEERWILTTQFAFTGAQASFAVLYDREGRVRWWREAPAGHRILRVYPGADGRSFVWASNIVDRSSYEGVIVRDFLDGTAPTTTVAPKLHHDFVEHPDGFAYLAYVDRDLPLIGRDFDSPLTSDAVMVVQEGSVDGGTDLFNFFDNFSASPSQPCGHSVLGNFVPGRIEWTHSNSIVADPGGDGWWVLARYLDQVVRIYADGTLGPIVGGQTPTLAYTGDGLPMSHGHFSQVLDNGHLLVFDNGDHVRQAAGSQVVELAMDDVSQTVSTVWTAPEPLQRFTAYLGDARRLDDGNTWIMNPDFGLYEVSPEGELLWQALIPMPVMNGGRVLPIAPMSPTSSWSASPR